MTAARLRTAAARLREVAEAAADGGVWYAAADSELDLLGSADAFYVATVPPRFASAVAVWLDDTAADWDVRNWVDENALAVADAVLGDREQVGS